MVSISFIPSVSLFPLHISTSVQFLVIYTRNPLLGNIFSLWSNCVSPASSRAFHLAEMTFVFPNFPSDVSTHTPLCQIVELLLIGTLYFFQGYPNAHLIIQSVYVWTYFTNLCLAIVAPCNYGPAVLASSVVSKAEKHLTTMDGQMTHKHKGGALI